MKNITVWQGSQVPMSATQGDSSSISATLYLVPQLGGEVIEITANYESIADGVVADLTFTAPDAGVYDYYVTENFEDETSIVYPDPENCTGDDCILPTITVCELPDGVTS